MKLQNSPIRGTLHATSGRRDVLKLLGLTALTVPLASCMSMMPGGQLPDLGNGDTAIMNLALLLECLETDYYAMVLARPYAGMIASERTILTGIYRHEVAHRDFLRKALASDAIAPPDFDFSRIDFTDRNSVLTTARDFEELGVAAYNGAGNNIQDQRLLASAGTIVSVEARHAAILRDLLEPGAPTFAPNALDSADNRTVVLRKARPFIARNA